MDWKKKICTELKWCFNEKPQGSNLQHTKLRHSFKKVFQRCTVIFFYQLRTDRGQGINKKYYDSDSEKSGLKRKLG